MRTGLLLAVDGGNSKTDVAVLRTDGTILGRARAAGSVRRRSVSTRRWTCSPRCAREAMASAGVSDDVVVDGITAFLAGADLPYEIKALREEVGARRWAVTQRVDNDSYAVLRAGASRPWGVGVVCGTGINCVGVAPTAAPPASPRWAGSRGLGRRHRRRDVGAVARGAGGGRPRPANSLAHGRD